MSIFGVVGAVLAPVVVPWVVAPVGSAGATVLGGWWLVLLLWGIGVVRRAPAVALLVLLQGLLLTSCVPPSLALSPALQVRVAALADRLALLPVDPETGEPGATALLAAWRARVAASALSAPAHAIWEPRAPEEVSNVP